LSLANFTKQQSKQLLTFTALKLTTITHIIYNVYTGIRIIEKFVPGRTSTFLINSKFYTFSNYTLVHADTDTYPLSPNIAPVNAHYDTIDFKQLSALFQHTDSSLTSYQPSYAFSTTTSAVGNVFLQLMPSITSPILSFLITVVFLLSLIWAVVLTACTLRVLIPFILNRVRKRRQTSRDTSPDV